MYAGITHLAAQSYVMRIIVICAIDCDFLSFEDARAVEHHINALVFFNVNHLRFERKVSCGTMYSMLHL